MFNFLVQTKLPNIGQYSYKGAVKLCNFVFKSNSSDWDYLLSTGVAVFV